MNPRDWVMYSTGVGQIRQYGGMYCQIWVLNAEDKEYAIIEPTNEIFPITKEVADIIRSV